MSTAKMLQIFPRRRGVCDRLYDSVEFYLLHNVSSMNTVHTSTVIRVLAVSPLLHCTVNRRLVQFFPSSEWCDFITRNLEYGLLVLCNFTIQNCFISLHFRGHLRSYRSVSLLMSLDQIGRSDAEAQTFCFYKWFGWIDKTVSPASWINNNWCINDDLTCRVEKCHVTVPTRFVSFGYMSVQLKVLRSVIMWQVFEWRTHSVPCRRRSWWCSIRQSGGRARF